MTANTIGADHHNRADGVERCRPCVLNACRWLTCFDLGLQKFFYRRPIGIKCTDELAIFRDGPIGPGPGWTRCFLCDGARFIGQIVEKGPPFRIQPIWIFDILSMQLFNIGRVRAIEKTGFLQDFVVRQTIPVFFATWGLLWRLTRHPNCFQNCNPQFGIRLINQDLHICLVLQQFNQCCAQGRGRICHLDASRTHGFDFVLSPAFSAGNDGPGMTHATPGRGRHPGNKADNRLFDFRSF